MTIHLSCPSCGKNLSVRDEYAGQTMLCPGCSGQLTVPSGANPPDVVQPKPRREAEEPRRRPRRRRDDEDYRDTGFVPCPKCAGRRAERVLFTFWGSFYMPALLTHVRCPDCGATYNGKTGGSNLGWAIGCFTVPLIIILAILGGLAFVIFSAMTGRI
jgi:ribosomal protein S27E